MMNKTTKFSEFDFEIKPKIERIVSKPFTF